MARRMVVLLVAVLMLAGCAGRPPATPEPAPTTPAAALSSAVDGFVTTGSGPWVSTRAVLVSHRGELVAERYYFSDGEERADVFSVTKSVVATLVGIALADGTLRSLDQTLAELLPRQRGGMTEQMRHVTI